ncbi:LLM class flavin-dependent oxidoreductase [Couchioplanes caeruleus]|uniref:LLM class flavin-dependent oxidoreductase n=1 Tax=Couchioplanes caeruleus TaxID=56438 RepID=UPI0020C1455C|nr:LLM class flavin-dependent oxidoreductase [Couchioplanes caeruleus]UQU63712.1 LLM class flavin-dependent oxidoreductase [Couchioplanes caeruleus]
MTDLGAIFLPQNPPERLPEVARAADEAGLEQLWLWEDSFLAGGISAAAAALAVTTRLKVGIGILPVPFRNVAVTAMEVATLHRMFGDRPIVGLGHGVQEWMGQVGARAASPMTLLREYTTALKSLLNGEAVTTDGRFVRLDDVKLDWPPAAAPRVFIGGTGPKTLRLAGELADGTILTGSTTPDTLREARTHIQPPEGHEIVVFMPAATGPDAVDRLARDREKYGAPWLGAHGDAADIAAVVEQMAAAGADTVILQPTLDEPSPEGFIRFVAEEVRPLVK